MSPSNLFIIPELVQHAKENQLNKITLHFQKQRHLSLPEGQEPLFLALNYNKHPNMREALQRYNLIFAYILQTNESILNTWLLCLAKHEDKKFSTILKSKYNLTLDKISKAAYLTAASMSNGLEILEILHVAGAPFSQLKNKDSLMSLAASKNYSQLQAELIHPSVQHEAGTPPLFIAAEAHHYEDIRSLLDKKNIEALNWRNQEGYNALGVLLAKNLSPSFFSTQDERLAIAERLIIANLLIKKGISELAVDVEMLKKNQPSSNEKNFRRLRDEAERINTEAFELAGKAPTFKLESKPNAKAEDFPVRESSTSFPKLRNR